MESSKNTLPEANDTVEVLIPRFPTKMDGLGLWTQTQTLRLRLSWTNKDSESGSFLKPARSKASSTVSNMARLLSGWRLGTCPAQLTCSRVVRSVVGGKIPKFPGSDVNAVGASWNSSRRNNSAAGFHTSAIASFRVSPSLWSAMGVGLDFFPPPENFFRSF